MTVAGTERIVMKKLLVIIATLGMIAGFGGVQGDWAVAAPAQPDGIALLDADEPHALGHAALLDLEVERHLGGLCVNVRHGEESNEQCGAN